MGQDKLAAYCPTLKALTVLLSGMARVLLRVKMDAQSHAILGLLDLP